MPTCTFNPTAPFPPGPYDLNPNFFVGQPIDADPIHAPSFPANQMVIRIQNTPGRIESADALQFWILDSSEVARCLRGRMNADGTPDWDPALCDRAALGPSGEGHLFIGMTSETVRSFFSLKASCPQGYISADALGACTDGSCPDVSLCPGHGSWISFDRYGEIPTDLSVPVSPGFTVNFGESISASGFHVELCDVATVLAARDKKITPVPKPAIVGTLDGHFEFDLERGQAGQPFP